MKSCVFINSNPADRAIFVTALFDISPKTICFIVDDDREAFEILEEESIVPDYIFIELSMPGIDGIKFLRKIRKVNTLRKIPVIVHCATSEPINISALKERGAFAIYQRPYNYIGMCNVLSMCLNQESINLSLN